MSEQPGAHPDGALVPGQVGAGESESDGTLPKPVTTTGVIIEGAHELPFGYDIEFTVPAGAIQFGPDVVEIHPDGATYIVGDGTLNMGTLYSFPDAGGSPSLSDEAESP